MTTHTSGRGQARATETAPVATPEAANADADVQPPLPRRFSRYARIEPWLIGVASVVVVFVAWQIISARTVFSSLILPAPREVISAFGDYVTSDNFGEDVLTSGRELLIGFGLALGTGLIMGLLIGWYRRVRYVFDPFISFGNSTPQIALIPLLIVWFGIGIWSKVAVIYLGAFYPIVINTAAGIRSLDPALLRTARSFRGSDLQIFRTIALPGSVPFILTGIRLGVGHALIGMVVGELIAAQFGVGFSLAQAGATFQTARVFAILIIVSVTGLILQTLLGRLERRFDSWRPR